MNHYSKLTPRGAPARSGAGSLFLATASMIATAGLLSVSVTHAEDDGRPGSFYEHEYAKSPLDSVTIPKAGDAARKAGQSAQPGTTGRNSQGAPEKGGGVKGASSAREAKNPDVRSGMLAGFESQPVLSVGAILNAFDEQHAALQLEELAELLKVRKLYAGHIYLLHVSTLEPSARALSKLSIFGADTHLFSYLPKKYAQVKKSPTWIIRTEKGEYLLEGVESLAQFITADGGFVEEPVAAPAMEAPEPTPLPLKPDSF